MVQACPLASAAGNVMPVASQLGLHAGIWQFCLGIHRLSLLLWVSLVLALLWWGFCSTQAVSGIFWRLRGEKLFLHSSSLLYALRVSTTLVGSIPYCHLTPFIEIALVAQGLSWTPCSAMGRAQVLDSVGHWVDSLKYCVAHRYLGPLRWTEHSFETVLPQSSVTFYLWWMW